MRPIAVILITLLIFCGLGIRVMAKSTCCPELLQSLHECDSHTHGNGHHHHDSDPADTHPDEEHSDDKSCPPDCEGHHHHSSCVHSTPISLLAEHQIRIPIPHPGSLPHAGYHPRPPDDPVCELDKPPLI